MLKKHRPHCSYLQASHKAAVSLLHGLKKTKGVLRDGHHRPKEKRWEGSGGMTRNGVVMHT